MLQNHVVIVWTAQYLFESDQPMNYFLLNV